MRLPYTASQYLEPYKLFYQLDYLWDSQKTAELGINR